MIRGTVCTNLSEESRSALLGKNWLHVFFEGEMEWNTRFRLIPYSSIGVENGLLKGFVADELIVFEGRYFFQTSYPVLAVANQPFGKTDGYEIILHPNMV